MSRGPTAAPAASRPALRAVALPSEHGGWGLTLEPGLLGLLVAPSGAGLALALAALVAFLARTPLKLALVDRRRGRALERTVLARRVAALELVVLAGLVVTAVVTASSPFWVPLVLAAPLVLVEGWFDVRSRGRRLLPEVAGAVAVCAVVAMVVLADGGSGAVAAGLWLVLAARVVTSITHVRDRIAELHGRPVDPRGARIADACALVLAAAAVGLDPQLVAGAAAVLAVVVLQRVSARRPTDRAAVLGLRQMALGFGLVVVTALGVISTSG
jgi:YwiC-like protein